jgi:phosphoribosylanthranilate isomerase
MVKVKVCGLTNAGDALAAAVAGVDMLGFIFFPASRRYVTPEAVHVILSAVRDQRPEVVAVGVFVNEPVDTVCQVLDFCGLQLAQLHGEEPPEQLGLGATGAGPLHGRAFKALRPHCAEAAALEADRYALPPAVRGPHMPALLLDSYDAEQRGGTGQVGDWALAAALAAQYPLLLAGGLRPANVAQVVRAVRPWGVDVAGGVERAPGVKDDVAVRAFVAAARSGF